MLGGSSLRSSSFFAVGLYHVTDISRLEAAKDSQMKCALHFTIRHFLAFCRLSTILST